MKKIYVAPSILLVALGDDLMDVITPATQAGDDFSKRGFFDESAEDEDNTAETGSLWDEPMWQ